MVVAVPPGVSPHRGGIRSLVSGAPGRRFAWLRHFVAVIGLVVAVVVIVQRMPNANGITAALRAASVGWLAIAAFGYAASVLMFAEQQRVLLRAYDVNLTFGRLSCLSVVRSAIAVSMPAGSAVSAAYAFHQYRRAGSSPTTATNIVFLTGLSSLLGLVVLYLGQALTIHAAELKSWLTMHAEHVVAGAVATVGTAVAVRHAVWRRSRRLFESVPSRAWMIALCAAAASWLADLVSLYAAVRAAHLAVSIWALAGMFLVVHAARQFSITPGGVGVIEASLLAGLISLGGDPAAAFVAVLGYRLISFWLILPLGLGAWWMLYRMPPGRSARAMRQPRR